MNDQLARSVGDRVRLVRTAAHQTKTVVAGLAGISWQYLYDIERGHKLPTLPVLTQLAEVLRVAPADLVSSVPRRRRPPHASITADGIYRAMTQAPPPQIPVDLTGLHQHVREAWEAWQTSPYRYSRLTTDLPELIAATDATVRTTDGATRRRALTIAADLYGLLRTVTKRVGRGDLSLLAADRAIKAAELADDPVRIAGARWNMTHVLLADGQADAAEALAMHAVDALRALVRRENLDAAAMSGSLLLIAAVAAVRGGQPWTGRERLQQAAPLADRVGERNTCWTAFGPTNVAMHGVSIEVESGEAVEGLRLAETICHDRSPSIERRVAFLLDNAKGHFQRRDFSSSISLLQTAEHDAPEDVRFRPSVHALLRTLVKRSRGSASTQAAEIAVRIGLPL